MPNIQIVTDSCANLALLQLLHQHPITVVPNRISFGGKTYREGVDLSPEDGLRLMANQPFAPIVTPPSEAEYYDVYRRLAESCDAIVSIHASQEVFASWAHAQAAARRIVGQCPVAVIDSQNLCAGQAMVVKVAAQAISAGETLDEVVRLVRGAVDRVYTLYYVETVSYLQQNRLMTPSHTILGVMLGIKPFIALEHGRLVLVEKVRTRMQAVDQLFEFVVEFSELEDIAILQPRSQLTEQARMLQDRLAVEFPGRYFPYSVYNPSLAALLGTDAVGVVVLENEFEMEPDEF